MWQKAAVVAEMGLLAECNTVKLSKLQRQHLCVSYHLEYTAWVSLKCLKQLFEASLHIINMAQLVIPFTKGMTFRIICIIPL